MVQRRANTAHVVACRTLFNHPRVCFITPCSPTSHASLLISIVTQTTGHARRQIAADSRRTAQRHAGPDQIDPSLTQNWKFLNT